MRLAILGLLVFMGAATAAWAEEAVTLSADPVPIIRAEINGHPVRLEVDLRMPDMLVLNPDAAERLGVRRVPFVSAAAALDDSRIRGRVARPRIVFADGGDMRAITGIFNVPATSRADGIIGPGALPFDIVTVALAPGSAAEREIAIPLRNADIWEGRTSLAGVEVKFSFDLANAATTFNRTASARLDEAGAIAADGAHTETPMVLGLRAQTQPVRTALTIEGLPLNPGVARTRAPLLGALDEESIVVVGEGEPPPPNVWVGRQALAGCSSVSVDRRARRMILRCAAG
ncbi:MAG: hypothetical protein JNM59_00365 [Hyphomonadaceae bacterium]|nr:hypothetical protein [Hyphomonadaceae bacterium]